LTWSFFFSRWRKGGKGITILWTFSIVEGDEESLRDEELDEAFSLGSS